MSTQDVTQLLKSWREGQKGALEQLMPMVHDTLHGIAERYMRKESSDHTLQATALVNEAFIKLCDAEVVWNDRAHFKAIAANSMRRILLDYARARRSEKRGGDNVQVTLSEADLKQDGPPADLLDLEASLQRLAEMDERKAKITALSFFGGMTQSEIAQAMSVSVNTVDRDLRFAKAWLAKDLNKKN